MPRNNIGTDNTTFVILSFEGIDSYSLAGGLGVRVTHLSHALAKAGYATHLFFVGDPYLKGEEISTGGKLFLHRWCQWISRYHPAGVYQGENGKLKDYTESIPPYLLEHIIKPALQNHRTVVVLAEEWHTAETVCRLSDLLQRNQLRDRVIIFWNANNNFGFERIDFQALQKACVITTVSRFMKQAMWRLGLNPLVIPNGIPKNLLSRVDTKLSAEFRQKLGVDLLLIKVARWDPDKRWNMAMEATARLKARGLKTILISPGWLGRLRT